MTDLIARLEAATEGSRELDAEIAAFLEGTRETRNTLRQGWKYRLAHGWFAKPMLYTSVIDCALSVLPPNHWWCAGDCKREKHARVCKEGANHDGHEAFGANVALALCIAALKARSAP